jgi:hypothetical protein
MVEEQDWRTESYRGMEVHVSALPHKDAGSVWDYTVRVAQPGDDSSAEGEIVSQSGDDGDYLSKEAAIEAGFTKGYSIVDELLK